VNANQNSKTKTATILASGIPDSGFGSSGKQYFVVLTDSLSKKKPRMSNTSEMSRIAKSQAAGGAVPDLVTNPLLSTP
jgi:hypothetical protein